MREKPKRTVTYPIYSVPAILAHFETKYQRFVSEKIIKKLPSLLNSKLSLMRIGLIRFFIASLKSDSSRKEKSPELLESNEIDLTSIWPVASKISCNKANAFCLSKYTFPKLER
jgi:hypothetical protein